MTSKDEDVDWVLGVIKRRLPNLSRRILKGEKHALLFDNNPFPLDELRSGLGADFRTSSEEQIVEFFRTWCPAEELDCGKDIRSKILPQLYGEKARHCLESQRGLRIPFVNGVSIQLVYDIPNRTVLSEEDLKRHELSPDDAYQLSRENLARYRQDWIPSCFPSQPEFVAVAGGFYDGFTAATILLLDLYPRLRPIIGQEIRIYIPTRGIFVAFAPQQKSPNAQDLIAMMKKRVAADFRRETFGVSTEAFLLTPDGIVGLGDSSDDDL